MELLEEEERQGKEDHSSHAEGAKADVHGHQRRQWGRSTWAAMTLGSRKLRTRVMTA